MRELKDAAGHRWTAEVVSHGRTSGYLNPRVHRPVVQFSCLDASRPNRYGSLPTGKTVLEDLNDAELAELLKNAKVH